MKIEKNRNRSIDIMKGLLIVLVVLGHSQAPVHRFIYLFHMAAFLLYLDIYGRMIIQKLKSLY